MATRWSARSCRSRARPRSSCSRATTGTRPPAGRPRALWLDLAPERDARGEITGVMCLVRDVTRLREQQAALTEVRERYRVVVDALPVGVLMCASDGRLMAANRAVESILGIT